MKIDYIIDRCASMSGILALLFVSLYFVFLSAAWAGETQDSVEELQEQTDAAFATLGGKRTFLIPIPIVSPTIGSGLGVSAMYLFQAGENAPPSSLMVGGFYTDSESWAGIVGTQTYLTGDKYRLVGHTGYFDMNLDFYGVGNENGDNGVPVPINQSGPAFGTGFLFRIADNLYLGPQYRYLNLETIVDKQGLPPGHPGELLPDKFREKSSGLGILLNYDSKDNKFYPHSGSLLDVTTNFASEALGSDLNYQQYNIGYDHYMEIGDEQILAWRATGCFSSGDAPIYDLCLFGGKQDAMRGYVGGQYRDEISLTTQVEYRRRLYKKWGMVAFGGIGQVAPSLNEFTAENILPSAGLGVRFRASEEQRVNLSLDYAAGKDSDAVYFRIGEAF